MQGANNSHSKNHRRVLGNLQRKGQVTKESRKLNKDFDKEEEGS